MSGSFIYFGSDNKSAPATYKDINDKGLVVRSVIDTMWMNTRNYGQLFKLIELLGSGRSTPSKSPQWVLGDDEPSDVIVDAGNYAEIDTILAASEGTNNLTFTFNTANKVNNGQMFRAFIYTDAANYADIVFRYYGTSNKVMLVSKKTKGTPPSSSSSNCSVVLLNTSTLYDGVIQNGTFIVPSYLSNTMERSREAVEFATHTNSDNFYADVSIEKQARSKYLKLMKTISNKLYTSIKPKSNASNFSDFGVMGGFDYFLRPDQSSADYMPDYLGSAITGVRGYTKVIDGNTISLSDLEDFMINVGFYGSRDKILIGSPLFTKRFVEMARQQNLIVNSSNVENFVSYNNYFDGFTISTGYGNLKVIPDRSAEGIMKTVHDGSIGVVGSMWGYVLDPSMISSLTHSANGKVRKGVQDLALVPVKNEEGNNTVDLMEWDCTKTLMVRDPRSCGVIAFTS